MESRIDVHDLLRHLERYVGEELKVVTYKWLARKYCIDTEAAKRVLHKFLKEHKEKVDAVYVIAGWTKDTKSHTIKIVRDEQINDQKKLLEPITSLHVYSIAPKQKVQTMDDLWSVNHEQARDLYRRMMNGEESEEVQCLSHNKCGSISFDGVNRIVRQRAQMVQPPPPVQVPAAKMSFSQPDLVKRPASSQPKPKKRGRTSSKKQFSISTIMSQREEKSKDEPLMVDAEEALKAVEDEMESDPEDIVVQRRSSQKGLRSNLMQIDDDDDEEEEQVKENPGKETSRMASEEEEMKDGEDTVLSQHLSSISLSQQENSEVNGNGALPTSGTAQDTSRASQAGSQQGAVSGKVVKRRKVMKVYYDKDGCEVTEEVWENVAEESDEEKDSRSEMKPLKPRTTQKSANGDNSQSSQLSTKKKKKGKKQAGQPSIMSFFGK